MFRVDRFWFCYFLVRLFYLVFMVFVYSRLTTVTDTIRYLSAPVEFSRGMFTNSTMMMDFIGGIFGRLFGGGLLAQLPAMLVSFFAIRWGVEKLGLRRHVNPYLLFMLLSLPNFCVWTSIVSKEVVAVVYCVILGVLTVRFLQGDFRVRFRDLVAFYLCGVFKPQYLVFIVQGLLYIKIAQKFCKTAWSQFVLGVVMVLLNVGAFYVLREPVTELAELVSVAFVIDAGDSNRNEHIWDEPGAVFTKAPMGMFVAFVGPTFREMLARPMNMIAGLEGLFIVFLFLRLAVRFIIRNFWQGKLAPLYFFSYFIIITGIAFVHYPFGIFNPGSAIRYRTNFMMLFILLLLYLYVRYSPRSRVETVKT